MSDNYVLRGHRPRNFLQSVFGLIGHLLATSTIYVAIIIFGWGISFLMHKLHEVHQFPEEILRIFVRFEVYLTYADILIFVLFMFAGLRRFYIDLREM